MHFMNTASKRWPRWGFAIPLPLHIRGRSTPLASNINTENKLTLTLLFRFYVLSLSSGIRKHLHFDRHIRSVKYPGTGGWYPFYRVHFTSLVLCGGLAGATTCNFVTALATNTQHFLQPFACSLLWLVCRLLTP